MTTYVLLIYRNASPDEPLPKGDERAALAGHRAVQAESAAARQLHAVARLDAPGKARTVRVNAQGHELSDGPYVEAKEWLVGFYLVDCADEAQAVARAKQLCDAHHGVEVRPVDWRWRKA